MERDEPLVYIVDDDEAIRRSLELLMKAVGLRCRVFGSAAEFLDGYDAGQPGCLIADIRMPGMSGLDLQTELNRRGAVTPVIFLTGYGDVPMAVDAMKSGALDFMEKPFRDQDLLDRINQALARDTETRARESRGLAIRKRLATLTPRESEVVERVTRGQANKVIAMDLGVSQRTIEVHRARAMRKIGVRSVADLVRAVHSAKA